MDYRTSTRCARHLKIDDRFKMGGSMYRIHDTVLTERGGVIIWAYPLTDHNVTIRIEVSTDTMFKIYNLK